MISIRAAQESDLPAITEIYNEAILTSTATFDTEVKSVQDRRAWFTPRAKRHPVLVAEARGQIVGWGALGPWSERKAYDATAENSVYVRSTHRGLGAGHALLEALLVHARASGLHSIIAKITAESDVSIRLHETLGFTHVGMLREVGTKFGRVLDVEMMQIILD